MKALKIIGIVLAAIVGIALIAGLIMPSKEIVSRSRLINAPDSVLYNQTVNLGNWLNWFAWHRLDPNMKIEYSSTRSGIGAWYSWSGNDKVGKGKFTITDVVQNKLVANTLVIEGLDPNTCRIKFNPQEGKTLMTMEMDVDLGNNPFIKLMMPIFTNYIGSDYDKCLANMDEFVSKK